MTTWITDELRRIAAAEELQVAPLSKDGVTYCNPTPIWSVALDGALYACGYNGRSPGCYQAAIRHKAGQVSAAGLTREVSFESIDGPINDLIDEAYRAKYRRSPYVGSITSENARSATVRIMPCVRPDRR